ncbi:hypothetical protein ACFTZB_44220 [Rhodococcus sp. NPDC057014]|uniref:hypothetical protein n=1 Tax=Rhodococcus sp. NPDC057014 TaxID=3346000 RepID=UPI00363288F8
MATTTTAPSPTMCRPIRRGDTTAEADTQRYQEQRKDRQQRRRIDRRGLSPETYDVLEFARKWAPYGGPPDEETWVHFGMNSARFADRYRQVVAQEKEARTTSMQDGSDNTDTDQESSTW